MTKIRSNRGRGFTLIETLISLALAAFLMSGTAALMLRAAHLKKKADIVTAAVGLAHDRLSFLRAQPFDGPALAEGEHEEIRTDGPTGREFRIAWDVEAMDDRTKTVRVRAAPSRTSEKGAELILILERDLGF